MPVFLLDDSLRFPDPRYAEKGGLAAVGGDLCVPRLLSAYRQGFFPWFNDGDPILWWHPDPRYVLRPAGVKISKSMRALLRRSPWRVSLNTAFGEVIRACAGDSLGRTDAGTWITEDMIEAYSRLHRAGYAHSVEVWQEDRLIAGLYGISLGKVFFGESMFTRQPNASKYGFLHLAARLERHGFGLIDCQQGTSHLISLGAEAIPRTEFLDLLDRFIAVPSDPGEWAPGAVFPPWPSS